ncbi:MAG: DUF4340 domain-containing protein [Acidobacteria bacterium]|nr:DUF4340 domain-containing protein [Acidobacteriota bacterium]
MRFKGTLVLLIVVAALGSYIYFYEIKGGEKREKAKEAESQFWKIENKDIQQIEFITAAQHITAVRKAEKEWALTTPRQLDADTDELDRMVSSASSIKREGIVEQNAADPAKFGLNPPQSGIRVKTKDGKVYALDFGHKNPTGNSAYASIPDQKQVYLVPSHVVNAFDKKVDDLRNQSVLSFEQPEAQFLSIKSSKGSFELVKDSTDRWWFGGMGSRAADSPGVRGILNALSMGRVKGFFNDNPEDYVNLNLEKPLVEVTLTYGKDKAIKRLIIGQEKSRLTKKPGKARSADDSAGDSDLTEASGSIFLAKDASRPDLFFIEKDLVDKLFVSPDAIRDKALVPMQRWDVDSIILSNTKGKFSLSKSAGEWFVGDKKKKAKWDAVNSILDVLEKPVKGWVDNPSSAAIYGLDKPGIHIILKQGSNVVADCSFGKAAKNGIYAQVKGDSSVKIADPEGLAQLDRSESDYVENPAAGAAKK